MAGQNLGIVYGFCSGLLVARRLGFYLGLRLDIVSSSSYSIL